MKPQASDKYAGFTLVELVIVILIISILAVIAIPRLLSTDRFSALLAAEMAITDIRATQMAALFDTSSTKTITFNGDDTYDMMGTEKTLPGGATAGAHTITYNSFGEPTAGVGVFDIACGANTETIAISSVTGKATIQ